MTERWTRKRYKRTALGDGAEVVVNFAFFGFLMSQSWTGLVVEATVCGAVFGIISLIHHPAPSCTASSVGLAVSRGGHTLVCVPTGTTYRFSAVPAGTS